MVEVVASIGDAPHTRVSEAADNKYTFDDKDKIHIAGWSGNEGYMGEFMNNPDMRWDLYEWWNDAVSTYDETSDKWNTEPYMCRQNGEGLYHHFLAWWPENIVKSSENLTAVDVIVDGDYARDDILLAHWSGERPADNVLNLEFKHLLPDLTTNTWKFKFENEFKSITLTHTGDCDECKANQ